MPDLRLNPNLSMMTSRSGGRADIQLTKEYHYRGQAQLLTNVQFAQDDRGRPSHPTHLEAQVLIYTANLLSTALRLTPLRLSRTLSTIMASTRIPLLFVGRVG